MYSDPDVHTGEMNYHPFGILFRLYFRALGKREHTKSHASLSTTHQGKLLNAFDELEFVGVQTSSPLHGGSEP